MSDLDKQGDYLIKYASPSSCCVGPLIIEKGAEFVYIKTTAPVRIILVHVRLHICKRPSNYIGVGWMPEKGFIASLCNIMPKIQE